MGLFSWLFKSLPLEPESRSDETIKDNVPEANKPTASEYPAYGTYLGHSYARGEKITRTANGYGEVREYHEVLPRRKLEDIDWLNDQPMIPYHMDGDLVLVFTGADSERYEVHTGRQSLICQNPAYLRMFPRYGKQWLDDGVLFTSVVPEFERAIFNYYTTPPTAPSRMRY